MINIQIRVSTNTSEIERQKYNINQESIYEFTGIGFSEDVYEGTVVFFCPPRAIDPGWIQIIVDLKDLAETVIAWGTIFTSIVKFYKKNKNYRYLITIKRKKGDKEIKIDIPVNGQEESEDLVNKVIEWFNID